MNNSKSPLESTYFALQERETAQEKQITRDLARTFPSHLSLAPFPGQTALVIEPSTLAIEPTTLPIEPTTIPIELTTLPIEPTTIPNEPTTLAIEPTTLAIELTTLPFKPTTLAFESTTLNCRGFLPRLTRCKVQVVVEAVSADAHQSSDEDNLAHELQASLSCSTSQADPATQQIYPRDTADAGLIDPPALDMHTSKTLRFTRKSSNDEEDNVPHEEPPAGGGGAWFNDLPIVNPTQNPPVAKHAATGSLVCVG